MYNVLYNHEDGYLLSIETLRFVFAILGEDSKLWRVGALLLNCQNPCAQLTYEYEESPGGICTATYSVPIVEQGSLLDLTKVFWCLCMD